MFDNFAEYMYYLLTTPFKRMQKSLNQWYTFCTVIGKWFDECEEDLYRARAETMAATCSNEMLRIHGEDRKLTRYDNEKYENFRARICMYEEICQLGGTEAGIMLAVKNLGFDGHSIVLAKVLKNDPERWAEFYILLPFSVDDSLPIGARILKKVVRDIKEVGAKDNYQFQFSSEAEHEFKTSCIYKVIHRCYPRPDQPILLLDGRWQLNGEYELSDFMNASMEDYPLFLDGAWELSGHYRLSGYQLDQHLDLYPLLITSISHTSIPIYYESMVTVHKDLWFLDGKEPLDGSHSLASDITAFKL